MQPPPETFALFDECIVLDRGHVIYSGIVRDVLHHFHEIGYQLPPRMDLAEWLQCICQPDGGKYRTRKKTLNAQLSDILQNIELWDISSDEESAFDTVHRNTNSKHDVQIRGSSSGSAPAQQLMNHLSNAEFVDAFMYSHRGQEIMENLLSEPDEEVQAIAELPEFLNRYQNNGWTSLKFVIEREFIIMWRARHVLLRDRMVQNFSMALLVGLFFYEIGKDVEKSESLIGVFFHSVRYIALNAAREVIPQLDLGPIVQKQHNSNFFPMYTYILGRSLALVPLFFLDALMYGVPVYFMCCIGFDAIDRIGNLMTFIGILFISGYTVFVYLGIFSAGIRNDKSLIIATMAVQFFVMVLTSGYTVQFDSIQPKLHFLYWSNYMAWVLRAMVVNEFRDGAEKVNVKLYLMYFL